MKKTLIFVLSAVFAFAFVTSCNKKKEEKKAVAETPMAADMEEPMKEEPMKEEPKKEEPPKAAEDVTPPTMTQIAEIGVPKVAVYINLAKMVESPLLKDTGLIDKMNVSFIADSKKKEEMDKLGKCLGTEITTPTNILSSVVVFSDGTENNMIGIVEMPVEAEKLIGCMKDLNKENKMEEATIGGAKGYKITNKKKEVVQVVVLDKNKVLFFSGEQKDFVAKLKVGEGNIGKGDVLGYFPGGPHCLKVITRELDVEKLAKGMIPNIKTLDLDAMVGMANGLKVDVKADTKDAKAAETLSSMLTVGKNNPQAKAQLKAMGMDENLLDKVVIAANGTVVTVKIDLDVDTVKGIVEKVKMMMPQTGAAPAAPAPAADDMKADDMKADDMKAADMK